MRKYVVDPVEFFRVFQPVQPERIGPAITDLIERYEIRNKTVLSIGGGTASEEYWFWKNGDNRLVVVDIDEHGRISPELARMDPREDGLAYYVGDATQLFAGSGEAGTDAKENGIWSLKRFWPFRRKRSSPSIEADVVYISSLTPDEFRREAILRDRSEEMRQKKIATGYYDWEWAPWQDPFHDLIMTACDGLRPGGLLIVQSYYGGVDTTSHFHFLSAVERQLGSKGIEFLEGFRLEETPAVNLFVGQKRGGKRPQMTSPIRHFHGRAEKQERVVRTWPRNQSS